MNEQPKDYPTEKVLFDEALIDDLDDLLESYSDLEEVLERIIEECF